MTFGQQLKTLRELHGFTAAEASRRIGMNEAQLWRYEHEKLNPPKRYSTILRIAKGIKLSFLETEKLVDLALDYHEQEFRRK